MDTNKPIFEIQNSDINVLDIMEQIESNLAKRSINKDEIEKIVKLKFTPNSPEGYREFDPCETANLFEKGISPPKFTNPSLKFIKGPLKWLIIQFVKLYSILDKKISQNRIHAFYSVVHEMILLKKSQNYLSERFNQLYKDQINLESKLQVGLSKNVYINRNSVRNEFVQKSDQRILELINEKSVGLVVFPEWDAVFTQLKSKFVNITLLIEDKMLYDYFNNELIDKVLLVDSICNFTKYENYSFIFFQSNICLLPPFLLEKILRNMANYTSPQTKIFLRYSNSSIDVYTPFQRNHLTHINESLLHSYLKGIGFQNIILHQTDSDEFKLISFCK
ncbi:MAG: hypothetical protein H7A23_01290 [Leptospiraceae bacterium]|nr:hypothetical protein [Leptospiraceae bacterium]